MDEILANYKVVFSTPMAYPFHNRADTINELMSIVLEDHYTIYDVNSLVNGIDKVIMAVGVSELRFETQGSNLLLVTKSTCFFYNDADAWDADHSIPANYFLPTSDFQIIALAWRNYLINSPQTPGSVGGK